MSAVPAGKLAEENAALQAKMIALGAEENRDRIRKPARDLAAAKKKVGNQPQTPEGQLAQIFVEQAAQLDDLTYETARVNLAKNAGMRASVLDAARANLRPAPADSKQGEPLSFEPIEPWPEPVKVQEVLSEIARLVRLHVVLSADAAIATALWIAVTYFVEDVDCAPILAILSATKRCGKSTLEAVLSRLVLRSMPASNISPAMIFRTIQQCKPTLLIDEADSFLASSDEYRGLLNSGHTRETAFVIRGIGDDYEPRKFSTWGFKAIAAIGKLPGTIADRSIVVTMERKARSELCERLSATPQEVFEVLCRKLARIAADNFETIKTSAPIPLAALNDRENDCWQPLFAIADLAGTKWGERARLAALALQSKDSDADDLGVELLQDAFRAFGADEKLRSEVLIQRLTEDVDRPWATLNRGKPISSRQLGAKLRPFGITSGSVRLDDGHTPKGYKRADFARMVAKYPLPSATPPQVNNGAASSDFPIRHTNELWREQKTLETNNGAGCGVVADKTGGADL